MTRSPPAPVLDLDGTALRVYLERLLEKAERVGGVGRLCQELSIKVQVFEKTLAPERLSDLDLRDLLLLANFMPTVRRRIGPWFDAHGIEPFRQGVIALLRPQGGEFFPRWQAFLAQFPQGREHRWIRDFAAEALHFSAMAAYPLMCRWVWDAGTRTGVLRELWYATPERGETPDVPDTPACFYVLRDEIEGFLRENGMFRDLPLITDWLFAEVYAHYLNDRGSGYLKSDFAGEEDPLHQTRRMLGLDTLTEEGIRLRTRLPVSASSLLH
jgi:hypothetical protein